MTSDQLTLLCGGGRGALFWGLGELLFKPSLFLHGRQFLFQCPGLFCLFVCFCNVCNYLEQIGRSLNRLQVILSRALAFVKTEDAEQELWLFFFFF